MSTVRLTMGQALVRYLCNQYTVIDGKKEPLFAGLFGIFGHGNVTCISEALEAVQDMLPTWRGQNEQSMALAAVAYAKAMRRRQMMIALSSIGPGALNMVTAAGCAHANRLPVKRSVATKSNICVSLLSGAVSSANWASSIMQWQVAQLQQPPHSPNKPSTPEVNTASNKVWPSWAATSCVAPCAVVT